ncbi:hypothetical protein [Gemmatimonas sp.]|uniref:hypothetical protein n=1 Tax=Gemmatimonas sp. TaxID=1962908 RepID=UPI00286DD77B|nr:hypothetical protein [Gemmatimonas sp.]
MTTPRSMYDDTQDHTQHPPHSAALATDAHTETPDQYSRSAEQPDQSDKSAKPDKPDGVKEVQVHCDYISADQPITRKFPTDTVLSAIKIWARSVFVPNPPSDKAYYLNDDKSRHRFTAVEEEQTLAQLGYERGAAHFRLNEEQASGT